MTSGWDESMVLSMSTSTTYDAQTISDMRAWVADCEWRDDVEDLTDAEIVTGIQRHYDGGLAAFVADNR